MLAYDGNSFWQIGHDFSPVPLAMPPVWSSCPNGIDIGGGEREDAADDEADDAIDDVDDVCGGGGGGGVRDGGGGGGGGSGGCGCGGCSGTGVFDRSSPSLDVVDVDDSDDDVEGPNGGSGGSDGGGFWGRVPKPVPFPFFLFDWASSRSVCVLCTWRTQSAGVTKNMRHRSHRRAAMLASPDGHCWDDWK